MVLRAKLTFPEYSSVAEARSASRLCDRKCGGLRPGLDLDLIHPGLSFQLSGECQRECHTEIFLNHFPISAINSGNNFMKQKQLPYPCRRERLQILVQYGARSNNRCRNLSEWLERISDGLFVWQPERFETGAGGIAFGSIWRHSFASRFHEAACKSQRIPPRREAYTEIAQIGNCFLEAQG